MDCKTIFLLAFFQCLCLIQPKEALFVNKKSLSENIQDGLKFAGKIFGIDHASEIADMVAKTFSNKSQQHKYQNRQDDPGDYNSHNTFMVSNILQLIGLDSAKIGALAVNGIIFIAQVITLDAAEVIHYMRDQFCGILAELTSGFKQQALETIILESVEVFSEPKASVRIIRSHHYNPIDVIHSTLSMLRYLHYNKISHVK